MVCNILFTISKNLGNYLVNNVVPSHEHTTMTHAQGIYAAIFKNSVEYLKEDIEECCKPIQSFSYFFIFKVRQNACSWNFIRDLTNYDGPESGYFLFAMIFVSMWFAIT